MSFSHRATFKINLNLPLESQASVLVDEIVKQVDEANYNKVYLKYFRDRIIGHEQLLKEHPPKEEQVYEKYTAVLQKILEYVREVKKPGTFSQRFINFFRNVINPGEVMLKALDFATESTFTLCFCDKRYPVYTRSFRFNWTKRFRISNLTNRQVLKHNLKS